MGLRLLLAFWITLVSSLCQAQSSFCLDGTKWSSIHGGCIPDNPSDTNFDGCVDIQDFMSHLAAFDTGCEQTLDDWECGIPLEYKGYNYKTVRIGEQCWFAENLRSKEWRDFDGPLQSETEHCYPCDGPAFYTYGNDLYGCNAQYAPFDACYAPFSFEEYGLLYNGLVVRDERAVCPSGWKVPSQADFELLIEELGGSQDAVISMTEEFGWSVNFGSNQSGFSAKPTGYLDHDSGSDCEFSGAGGGAYFFTTTAGSPTNYNWPTQMVIYWGVASSVHSFAAFSVYHYAFPIRCIQNE